MHLMLTANEDSTEKGLSKLTDEEIIGQCQIFLFAGYETSSNTLAYISYQLALNQNVQDKLREEIKEAVKRNPNSSLYDLSHDIDYLDCVMNESLRLNPPLAQVNRECVDDYKFNDIYIPAGLQVIITVYFLHRDHDVWPNPEKFDPERFRSPAKDGRHPYQFLPFGLGPRSCIGMRFALMEIKIALVKFLMKYKFVRSPETQVPLKILAGVTLILKSRENRKGLELFASAFLFYFCVWCVFLRLISCYHQFSKLWDLMLVADILDPGKDILEDILKLESPVCEKKEENYLLSSKFKTKVQLSINLRRMIRLINLQNVSINFAMNF